MGDPGPIFLVPYEPFFLRAAFAWVLHHERIGSTVEYDEQPYPVGLARFCDLTWLSRTAVARLAAGAMWVSTGCYVAGVALPVVLPLLALFFLLRETLRNSQGAIHHSRQAIAWVLIAQSGVYVAAAIRDPGSVLPVAFGLESGPHAWALYASQQVIVAVYLTAGITKVIHRGIDWLRRAPNIAVEIVKSAEQKYHDCLDSSFLDRAAPLVRQISIHPWPTRLALGGGLALELMSPLMLRGRVAGLVLGALFILFHRTTGHYMGLTFLGHQKLLLVFFLNAPYALARVVAWLVPPGA